MLLKTHCLDLKPKKVLPDPLFIKTDFPNSKRSEKQLKTQKLPKRKFCPQKEDFHLKKKHLKNIFQIQKNVQKDEKNFSQKKLTLIKNFFGRVTDMKIYLPDDKMKIPPLCPINRAQSAKKLYHQIFVEPKMIELTKINENMRRNILQQPKSTAETIIEKKLFSIKYETPMNPTFILNQPEKKSRIVSAFVQENNNKRSEIEKMTMIDEEESILNTNKKIRQFSAFCNNSIKEPNQRNNIERPSTFTFELENYKQNKIRFFSSHINKENKHRLERLNINSNYNKRNPNFEEVLSILEIDKKYFTEFITLEYSNLKKIIFYDFRNEEEIDDDLLCVKNNKRKILSFLNYIVKYEEKNMFEKAIYYLKKIYISKEFQIYKNLESFILNHLSYSFFKINNLNSSFEILKEFLENCDIKFKSIVYFNIIICLRKLNNYSIEKFYLIEYENFSFIMKDIENRFFSTILFFLFLLNNKHFKKAEEKLNQFEREYNDELFLKEIRYFRNFLPKSFDQSESKIEFPKIKSNKKKNKHEFPKNQNDFGESEGLRNFNNFKICFNNA